MPHKKEPATTELLNFVNPTKGISRRVPKSPENAGIVRKEYPTVSNKPSITGEKVAPIKIMITYIGLLIRIKRMKTKSSHQRRLSFGMSPRRIPQEKAWAISPGFTFAFNALNKFTIDFIMITLYHTKSL